MFGAGVGMQIEMRRSGNDFTYIHNLKRGKHAYKFIVDEEWRFAPDQVRSLVSPPAVRFRGDSCLAGGWAPLTPGLVPAAYLTVRSPQCTTPMGTLTTSST